MDEPEIIKMLKYILLISGLVLCVQCHPLVTEEPSIVPVPIHHPEEKHVSPSLLSDSSGGGSKRTFEVSSNDGAGGKVQMSPVLNISDISDELASNNTGGHKHVRQVLDTSSSGSPPPTDELCSIFQFFLEPRRYSRCRVSNAYSDNEQSQGTRSVPDSYETNSQFHRPISNEVSTSSDSRTGDVFSSQSENREIESLPLHEPRRRVEPSPSASKRYDQLDDFDEDLGDQSPPSGSDEDQPHHPPPPHHHHHRHHPLPSFIGPPPRPPPPGPPPMYPKSSLDRTTIIVPERPCPRGERRDHKGFCRRIVRVRPSYQYGPPPPPYGQSRPVRYYYSRFVSVPTLQFFIPSVP